MFSHEKMMMIRHGEETIHGGWTQVNLILLMKISIGIFWRLIFCTTFDHSVWLIIFSDQNIYSEPPGNQDSQNPLDDDIGITNPRNEKALEKMGELHSVTYSGSKRILWWNTQFDDNVVWIDWYKTFENFYYRRKIYHIAIKWKSQL